MEWTKEMRRAAYMIIYEPLPQFKNIHVESLCMRTPDGIVKIGATIKDG